MLHGVRRLTNAAVRPKGGVGRTTVAPAGFLRPLGKRRSSSRCQAGARVARVQRRRALPRDGWRRTCSDLVDRTSRSRMPVDQFGSRARRLLFHTVSSSLLRAATQASASSLRSKCGSSPLERRRRATRLRPRVLDGHPNGQGLGRRTRRRPSWTRARRAVRKMRLIIVDFLRDQSQRACSRCLPGDARNDTASIRTRRASIWATTRAGDRQRAAFPSVRLRRGRAIEAVDGGGRPDRRGSALRMALSHQRRSRASGLSSSGSERVPLVTLPFTSRPTRLRRVGAAVRGVEEGCDVADILGPSLRICAGSAGSADHDGRGCARDGGQCKRGAVRRAPRAVATRSGSELARGHPGRQRCREAGSRARRVWAMMPTPTQPDDLRAARA